MENQKFTFNCPHCGQPLKAEIDWVGLECDCPSCGRVIQIPATIMIADNGKSAKCDESLQKEQDNANEGIGLGPKGAIIILLGVIVIGLLARLTHSQTDLQSDSNRHPSKPATIAESSQMQSGGKKELSEKEKAAKALAALFLLGQMAQMADNQRQQEALQRNAWGDDAWGELATQRDNVRLSQMQRQLEEQQRQIQLLQMQPQQQGQTSSHVKMCPKCQGAGRTQGGLPPMNPYVGTEPCHTCRGTGYVPDTSVW